MNWSSNLVEEVVKKLPVGSDDEDTKFALAISIIKMKEALEAKQEVQTEQNPSNVVAQRKKMSYLLRVCRIQQLMKEGLSPITKHETTCAVKESLEFFKSLLHEATCKEQGHQAYMEASIQLLLYAIEQKVFQAELNNDVEKWVHCVVEHATTAQLQEPSSDEFFDHKMFLARLVGRLSSSKPIASSIFEACVQYLSKLCKELKEHSHISTLQNSYYVFFMLDEAINNSYSVHSQSTLHEEIVCWTNQLESLLSTETLMSFPLLMQRYALLITTKIDKTG